jgi:hypothetical protein
MFTLSSMCVVEVVEVVLVELVEVDEDAVLDVVVMEVELVLVVDVALVALVVVEVLDVVVVSILMLAESHHHQDVFSLPELVAAGQASVTAFSGIELVLSPKPHESEPAQYALVPPKPVPAVCWSSSTPSM